MFPKETITLKILEYIAKEKNDTTYGTTAIKYLDKLFPENAPHEFPEQPESDFSVQQFLQQLNTVVYNGQTMTHDEVMKKIQEDGEREMAKIQKDSELEIRRIREKGEKNRIEHERRIRQIREDGERETTRIKTETRRTIIGGVLLNIGLWMYVFFTFFSLPFIRPVSIAATGFMLSSGIFWLATAKTIKSKLINVCITIICSMFFLQTTYTPNIFAQPINSFFGKTIFVETYYEQTGFLGVYNTTGIGRRIYNNGVYEGNFVNGLRHGHGRLDWSDGSWYDGNWINDRRTGHGTHTSIEMDVYVGEFYNNFFHGEGTLTYNDGFIFEGSWMAGQRNGTFRITRPNGNIEYREYVDDEQIENQNHGGVR
jgi:hypothetical protein